MEISLSAGPPKQTSTGKGADIYAALDLGTNNCRLLIAKPSAAGFRVIDSYSRITRLGEGLEKNGRLSDAAMRRTIAALTQCAEKIQRRSVTQARAVATEACRRAANGPEFMAMVRDETGLELDIVSCDEEAMLALAGCTPLLDWRYRRALVFDIGGGSTELTWVALEPGKSPQTLGWVSLPCGVVTLAERWGGAVVNRETYDAMLREVGALLEPFSTANAMTGALADGTVQLLGTSGTVTTIAAFLLDLPRYDRARVDGCWLEFDEVLASGNRLSAMSLAARAAHPCIGPDRADLVIAGCAIVEAIWRAWPVSRLRVADRGLREGVLLGLIQAA